MELYKALCEISGEGNVLKDEPMKMHTTFRIGGPADYFIQPSKIEEIRRIVAVCRECSTPYYIMGNGSNLLVGDKGFRGVIVQVFRRRRPYERGSIRRRDETDRRKCGSAYV